MAHLLNVEAASLALGTHVLLDAVSLGLDDGDRVGVVGRNGAGKSTVLRVLGGGQHLDGGRVARAGSLGLASLGQADDAPGGRTVRDLVAVGPDHTWRADRLVREVMTGLLGGLDAPAAGGLDRPLAELSGGLRRRVALAGVLSRPSDLLLLDEPTNQLDVEGVAWLARHLGQRWAPGRGALVVVTHDRWFLDAVCTRTWEVHDGKVDAYDGGYAAFVLARAERERTAVVREQRRQNLLRKELAWLRRGAPARTSKPQFRLDAAARLIADEPPPRDRLVLQELATARLGKDVIDLEGVTVAFPGGPRLLDGVTWRLGPGDRVGLVGVNGSGKTTLLRVLTGGRTPDAGRARLGATVRAAMLSQDVAELDEVGALATLQAVEQIRSSVVLGGRDVSAAQLLERLGLPRARQLTPVGHLSGGERRRVQLLRLLMTEPNVLALDEPTNDLDTETLAAVEDLLDGWPGTLVVVSHDRYLLERVCDRQVALLGDGQVRDLPGGVEQYLALRAGARPSPGATPASAGESGDASGASDSRDARDARKEMARLERLLARLAADEQALHEELARRATEYEAVLELDARLRELGRRRAELEDRWLVAAETSGH